jgi:hypothetical protein
MTDDLPPLEFALEPQPQAAQTPVTSKAKAHFQIDTRDKAKGDRRKNGDRRQTIRFEADRRCGEDRRPKAKGWELGIDV